MKTFKQFVKEMTGSKITRSLPGGGISVQDREHRDTASSSYGRNTSLTQQNPKNYNYDQDTRSRVDTKVGPVTRFNSDSLSRSTSQPNFTTSNDRQVSRQKEMGSTHITPNAERVTSSQSIKTDNTTTRKLPMNEKAPPGNKYERMVKHIKAGYAKDGELTDKEKSIAYATAWKAKNRAKK